MLREELIRKVKGVEVQEIYVLIRLFKCKRMS